MRTGVDAQAISIITFSRMSEDQSLYIPGLTDDAFDVLEAMANKRGFFGTQGTQYNGRSDMSNEAACNEAAAKARQDHNRVLADHPVQGQQAADYVHRDGNFSTLEWRRGR
jgi:virulence-associated protein VapD